MQHLPTALGRLPQSAAKPCKIRKRSPPLDRDEKRFNAKTGCNTLFGSYTLSDNQQLQFGAVASTLMACVDMDTEQRLGQALPKVKQYRFQGEALELLDEQGHTVVRGQRADKQ